MYIAATIHGIKKSIRPTKKFANLSLFLNLSGKILFISKYKIGIVIKYVIQITPNRSLSCKRGSLIICDVKYAIISLLNLPYHNSTLGSIPLLYTRSSAAELFRTSPVTPFAPLTFVRLLRLITWSLQLITFSGHVVVPSDFVASCLLSLWLTIESISYTITLPRGNKNKPLQEGTTSDYIFSSYLQRAPSEHGDRDGRSKNAALFALKASVLSN